MEGGREAGRQGVGGGREVDAHEGRRWGMPWPLGLGGGGSCAGRELEVALAARVAGPFQLTAPFSCRAHTALLDLSFSLQNRERWY